jgi:hypothetical protein
MSYYVKLRDQRRALEDRLLDAKERFDRDLDWRATHDIKLARWREFLRSPHVISLSHQLTGDLMASCGKHKETTMEDAAELYNRIEGFVAANGFSPTVQEICGMLGVTSKHTAHRYLVLMRKHGWLDWQPGKQRTIQLRRTA